MGRGGLGLRRKPATVLACLLVGAYLLLGGGDSGGGGGTKDDFAAAVERGGGIAQEKADLEAENKRLRDDAAQMAAQMKHIEVRCCPSLHRLRGAVAFCWAAASLLLPPLLPPLMPPPQETVSAQGRSAQPQGRAEVAEMSNLMTALDNQLAKDEAALQDEAAQPERVSGALLRTSCPAAAPTSLR
jgi:hypothetical protein